MIKMYKVYGEEINNQRESFSPSYKVATLKNITISVINSDITGTNNYSILKLEGENERKLEDEFEAQLSDGVFENSPYSITEEIKGEEFNKYINEYIPDIELVYARYLKEWQDNKGLTERITRKEAHNLIWEYYSNKGILEDEIENKIQNFDKIHMIDLGEYNLKIEVIK
jgi:hypothetical protein